VVFDWMRQGVEGRRRCVEAQVMDFADDVAYSVHDLEDGVVGGRIDLGLLDHADERAATWQTVRDWYLPDASDELLDDALGRVRSVTAWPDRPYDGSRRTLAALKNLTSDLIGIFCGSVHRATQLEYGTRPLVRHQADLVVPAATAHQIAVLKGIAAHYVMRAQDRVGLLEGQRTLLRELFEAMWKRGSDALDPAFRHDFAEATENAARVRVVIDQIASLTDASAVTRHADLVPRARGKRERLGP
jgi:dGTPase